MKTSAKARQMQFRVAMRKLKGKSEKTVSDDTYWVTKRPVLQIFFLGKWQDLPVYDEETKEYRDG